MDTATELARARAELAQAREQLAQMTQMFKAACVIADAALAKVRRTRGELAKARELSPPKLQDAIAEALSKTRGGQSAAHLIGPMLDAAKERRERESATPQERVAKASARLQALREDA